MPIYEYTCKDCGASCEKLLHVCSSEEIRFFCPECGSEQLEKVMSMFNAPSGHASFPKCEDCKSSANPDSSCPFRAR